eukprot:5569422-Amphidinium_carterae.1
MPVAGCSSICYSGTRASLEQSLTATAMPTWSCSAKTSEHRIHKPYDSQILRKKRGGDECHQEGNAKDVTASECPSYLPKEKSN